MMKQKFTALLLAAGLALGLAGCGTVPGQTEAAPQNFSVTWFDLFDTVTIVQGFAPSQEEWDRQMDALHADLLDYHRLYDIYNEYEGIPNVCTVNRLAGQGPVAVDSRILDLLELAMQVEETTAGQMNVALGSVLALWHNARDTAEQDPSRAAAPQLEELQAAAQHCDPAGVVLDRQQGTVELTDLDLRLDVGSIGKGYAVEMAARAAQQRGLNSALLNVGGNLRAIGTKPQGAQWTAGIQEPDGEGYRFAVPLEDSALVTSGDYQRYFMVDGVRMHHLIDPDTLYPAGHCRSVTVHTADSGLADGLSTALFCMDPDEGLALVESLDGVEALWILADNSTRQSSGFAARQMG